MNAVLGWGKNIITSALVGEASGAIDVIVVEQPDERLACTPFHIRFGKLPQLSSGEKTVKLKVRLAKRLPPQYQHTLPGPNSPYLTLHTHPTHPLTPPHTHAHTHTHTHARARALRNHNRLLLLPTGRRPDQRRGS
jgi:hypothetical protein